MKASLATFLSFPCFCVYWTQNTCRMYVWDHRTYYIDCWSYMRIKLNLENNCYLQFEFCWWENTSKGCSLIPDASEVKSEQSPSQESFGYHPTAPCRARFVFCFSVSREEISFPDDNNVAFLSHRIENLFIFLTGSNMFRKPEDFVVFLSRLLLKGVCSCVGWFWAQDFKSVWNFSAVIFLWLLSFKWDCQK